MRTSLGDFIYLFVFMKTTQAVPERARLFIIISFFSSAVFVAAAEQLGMKSRRNKETIKENAGHCGMRSSSGHSLIKFSFIRLSFVHKH